MLQNLEVKFVEFCMPLPFPVLFCRNNCFLFFFFLSFKDTAYQLCLMGLSSGA